MRRWIAALAGVGLLAEGMLYALSGFAAADAVSAPAARAHAPAALHAGQRLLPGAELRSASGRYRATVSGRGALIVTGPAGHVQWRSGGAAAGAYLTVGTRGQVLLQRGSRVAWRTDTLGSGHADVLTLRNDGVLVLTSGPALVWSSGIGNGCPRAAGRTITVTISRQLARFCQSGEQLRATSVTTGAVALGLGTPTGSWRIQARIRNTVLYPAGGGAYPVHYWLPYSGPYGLHDAPWQHFDYGSALYRTRGSHGCVHVPEATMAWLFSWAEVGTAVTVQN